MFKTKKILSSLLALVLIVNVVAIGASASIGDGNQLSADLNLEVGKVVSTVFTPLTMGQTLAVNEIITVRIAPQ
ncbi:MAG: hypothetical protein WCN92_10910, partial [Eubacteriales bacterium]